MDAGLPDVVIVTGSVGAGKSSVVQEASEILEAAGEHFAVVDLDALLLRGLRYHDTCCVHALLLGRSVLVWSGT